MYYPILLYTSIPCKINYIVLWCYILTLSFIFKVISRHDIKVISYYRFWEQKSIFPIIIKTISNVISFCIICTLMLNMLVLLHTFLLLCVFHSGTLAHCIFVHISTSTSYSNDGYRCSPLYKFISKSSTPLSLMPKNDQCLPPDYEFHYAYNWWNI